MKILSISSILPIPGLISSNDFVFQTYINYLKQFHEDSVLIIRPVKLDLNPVRVLKKTSRLSRLNKILTRDIYNFRVEVFPFHSTWGFRNIHAIITRTIYYLNAKRIMSLFSEHKFDIIHAQFIFPDALLAFMLHRKYRIPFVVTTHNERFYFDHRISKALAIKVLKSASGIYPINYSNYLFYNSIGLNKVDLLPLGFSSTFLRSQKIPSRDVTRILTVAELIKLKNIDKVLMALKDLVPKYNFLYTIIGRGPEKETLERLVEVLNLGERVTFIDHIPHEEIADEMYKHDIFIMPSYFETFGRVYFESMAMGIPVICAKNSGIYGIFKDGEEGLSVDHTKVDEIASALENLISDTTLRIRMGINGKRLVEQYTWENIAGTLHDKYLRVISRSNDIVT